MLNTELLTKIIYCCYVFRPNMENKKVFLLNFLLLKVAGAFLYKLFLMKFRQHLLVFFPIGNNILIFLLGAVVISKKFLLSSFLVIIDVCIDVKTAKKHLKRHWKNV